MFVASRVAAIAISIFLPLAAAETGKPNVVLVTLDTAGDGDSAGLERLAKEGTVLSHVIGSGAPAARQAEILSGAHALRCGVVSPFGGRNWLRPEVPLASELFRASGYRTAMIGTWYLGDNLPLRPDDRGYEKVFVHGSGGIGTLSDRWGNQTVDPWIRTPEGWIPTQGKIDETLVNEALKVLGEIQSDKPAFITLSLGGNAGAQSPAISKLLDEMERLKLSQRTLMVVRIAGEKGADRLFFRWPGRIAGGKAITVNVSPMDVYPSVVGFTGIRHFVDWKGDGVDLSTALSGKGEFPTNRLFAAHPGDWAAGEVPDRFKNTGFQIEDDRWKLVGTSLYDLKEDPKGGLDVFEQHPAEVTRLLSAYGRWWQDVRIGLLDPVRVRIGDSRQPVVRLSAMDWWPSLEVPTAAGPETVDTQLKLREVLARLTNPDEGPKMKAIAGRWRLQVAQTGHYRITISKVPIEMPKEERGQLAPFQAGTVHVRSGKYEERTQSVKGATAISMGVDFNEGPADLEAWVDNQLAEKEILGAFFVTIERTGERKLPDPDWKPQPK